MLLQRSAFGRIGGAVARQWGDRGFAGSLDFVLRGSGGQSFGCFMARLPRRTPPPAHAARPHQGLQHTSCVRGAVHEPQHRFHSPNAMLMFGSQGRCRWRAST